MNTPQPSEVVVGVVKRLARIHGHEPLVSAAFVKTFRHEAEQLLQSGRTEGENHPGWLVQLLGGFVLERGGIDRPRPGGSAMHLFITDDGHVLDFGIGDWTFDLTTLGMVHSLDEPL